MRKIVLGFFVLSIGFLITSKVSIIDTSSSLEAITKTAMATSEEDQIKYPKNECGDADCCYQWCGDTTYGDCGLTTSSSHSCPCGCAGGDPC